MIWIFLAVLFWGLVHSLLASAYAKELARKVFGASADRYYRLGYNIFSGVSFAPILVLMFVIPDHSIYGVPLPWSIIMVMGELLAVVALLSGLRQTDPWEFLGFRQLGESGKTSTLITSGLYRYVRHPLYSAGLAFIWLLPVMTVNIMAVNISLSVYVVIGAFFEERKLLVAFGQGYSDYKACTPMFVPFLKGNKSRHESS
jgi:protein-S-isoprenylcysteine O-methyltransferase Ste14